MNDRMTIAGLAALCVLNTSGAETKPPYTADWDDLNRYPQAAWLNELKFGLYWHWNYNSVAGYDGWYGRNMYDAPNGWVYKQHVKKHGDPASFGYKDFAPLFTAEKFSAKQWVADAQRIGARFIVGMAVHHDGFDLYDSSFTPWNSVDKPPHIDVIGELAAAARKKGMKFGATSHLAWNWNYFSTYMYPDKYDAKDAPELYNIHDPAKGASPEWAKEWYNRTTELIDNYELDFLWFDFGTMDPVFKDEYTAKLTAHFYNKSVEWNKTVALATKVGFENRRSQVHDVEHGKFGYIRYPQWMADCTMNRGWFNLGGKEDAERISGQYWLYQLIDIVSKNGTLLLNLGPKADGSWPEAWKQELFKMGDWLRLNGEAVYGTKPWHRYGEGPTHDGDGGHYNLGRNLTKDDVRFTRKGNVLYATVCGWRTTPILIQSLGSSELESSRIRKITMLASGESIGWKQSAGHLSIAFPKQKPCEFAYVFRIEGDGLFPERPDEYLNLAVNVSGSEMVSSIRVSIPGKAKKLALAEIIAIAKGKSGPKQNVAPKGRVSLSSTEGERAAGLAVDLNVNGNARMNTLAVSQRSDNPWFLLELDRPGRVSQIELFAGQEGYDELVAGGVVELIDARGNTFKTYNVRDFTGPYAGGQGYVGLPGQ